MKQEAPRCQDATTPDSGGRNQGPRRPLTPPSPTLAELRQTAPSPGLAGRGEGEVAAESEKGNTPSPQFPSWMPPSWLSKDGITIAAPRPGLASRPDKAATTEVKRRSTDPQQGMLQDVTGPRGGGTFHGPEHDDINIKDARKVLIELAQTDPDARKALIKYCWRAPTPKVVSVDPWAEEEGQGNPGKALCPSTPPSKEARSSSEEGWSSIHGHG